MPVGLGLLVVGGLWQLLLLMPQASHLLRLS